MNAAAGDAHHGEERMTDHWWWRPGWGIGARAYTWHITLEDQPALRALVAEYQRALQGVPTLDPVPEQWLHITTQDVGHTREVGDADRHAIIEAVRSRLAVVTPIEMTFARPAVLREGVALSPTDPAPLTAVRDAIRSGVADVWGTERVPGPEDFWPHLSLAYSNADADPEPIRAALDRTRAASALLTLRRASLIVLHRDHRMYQWTVAATAAVGRGRRQT